MRKKMLLAENSSLFAEVERKNTELEAIKLRLEEEKGLAGALKEENDNLKRAVAQLEERLSSANKEIEELKTELSLPAQTVIEPACFEETEEITVEEDKEFMEQGNTPSSIDCDIQNVISDIEGCNTQKAQPKQEPPKLSEEQRGELRRLGAAVIGRVTKTTAYVTAQLQSVNLENSDRLYSLALGKNESFKIQVLELVESDGVFEELCNRLNEMAETAAHAIGGLVEK